MQSLNFLINDVNKYIDYFFETKGFTSGIHVGEMSQQAIQTAKSIRGCNREPAIFIQGMMPRSGTVFVGELLRLHPRLKAYPYELWEFPALQMTGEVLRLQRKFQLSYKPGMKWLQQNDFLPLFGASLLAYLHEDVPVEQRLLIKAPSVQYLSYFFSMFPQENLLVLERDGRDLVHSTLRTWPQLNFLQVCLRWDRSARMVIHMRNQLAKMSGNRYWIAKYEDALRDPVAFVQQACHHLGLVESQYPFERIAEIQVIGSSKLEGRTKVTWRHLKRPQDFKPTEYWKQWSAFKKLTFKLVAGRSLIKLGYCDDLKW